MKLQNKNTLIMASFGIAIVFLLSFGYYTINHKLILNKELNNIKNVSAEIALHIESDLRDEATIAVTLSSAPVIKNALLKSNSEFSTFSDEIRKYKIETLNKRWINTKDIKDSFIMSHMTNPAAKYLRAQQKFLPGTYGEIFLTNRYGVMVATTGKLRPLPTLIKIGG
jgi:hypothetical protein